MRTSSLFRGLYQSFYSKSFYKEVAREWGGEVFVYLLLVLLLSGAVVIAPALPGLRATVIPLRDQVLRQIPVIRIAKGRATAEGAPVTITVRIGNTNIPLARIDTTEAAKPGGPERFPIYVTSRELIISQKDETRVRSFATWKDMELRPETLAKYFRWISLYGVAIGAVLFLLFFYVYRLGQSLLYALAGLLWNGLFFGAHLKFESLWRLSVVALTPSILLGAAAHYTHRFWTPRWYIHILLTYLYLGYAVWSNIPNENPEV